MNNEIFTLSNETTNVEFFKIEKCLSRLNINMFFLKKNPHKLITLNNDLKLEGHNNFYNSVLSLCTIGALEVVPHV